MSKTVMINDIQFEFGQLPSAKALSLFGELVKELGPLVQKLKGVDFSNIMESDISNLVVTFGGVMSEIKPERLEYFRKEFAEYSSFVDMSDGNTKPLKNVAFFEQCFKGDVIFMFSWMISFVKENFLAGMSLSKLGM